jgi:hypothetical protein
VYSIKNNPNLNVSVQARTSLFGAQTPGMVVIGHEVNPFESTLDMGAPEVAVLTLTFFQALLSKNNPRVMP